MSVSEKTKQDLENFKLFLKQAAPGSRWPLKDNYADPYLALVGDIKFIDQKDIPGPEEGVFIKKIRFQTGIKNLIFLEIRISGRVLSKRFYFKKPKTSVMLSIAGVSYGDLEEFKRFLKSARCDIESLGDKFQVTFLPIDE